jgi:hypothetical protein
MKDDDDLKKDLRTLENFHLSIMDNQMRKALDDLNMTPLSGDAHFTSLLVNGIAERYGVNRDSLTLAYMNEVWIETAHEIIDRKISGREAEESLVDIQKMIAFILRKINAPKSN